MTRYVQVFGWRRCVDLQTCRTFAAVSTFEGRRQTYPCLPLGVVPVLGVVEAVDLPPLLSRNPLRAVRSCDSVSPRFGPSYSHPLNTSDAFPSGCTHCACRAPQVRRENQDGSERRRLSLPRRFRNLGDSGRTATNQEDASSQKKGSGYKM